MVKLSILVALMVILAGDHFGQIPSPVIERQQYQLAPTGGEWFSPVLVVGPVGPVGFTRPAPFLVVGQTWRQTPSASLQLELRTSGDGVEWTDWMPIEIDQDTREAESVGAMLIIPAATRYLQYHLVATAGPMPDRVEIDLVNPGLTPETWRDGYRRKMSEKAAEGALDLLPRPPVITRTEWGCPDGQGTSRPPVSYTTVTHLIVHHTVNNNSSADWAAVVRAIWNFHFYDRGYIDIGYNYLIDPDGLIYEGRSGGDNVQGAHFSGVNAGTMGVALLGTFTGVEPTPKALESLRRLLAWKADQRGISPSGALPHASSGLTLKVISGHRDGPGATECPGESLYRLLPRLRAEVHNRRSGASQVTVASAASYSTAAAAPESIVAAYGLSLASATTAATSRPLPEQLAGVSVRLLDSQNREFAAPLFYVSPTQINLLLPAAMADGPATILVDPGSESGQNPVAAGSLEIRRLAPAIFTANASGRGVPAALLLRVRADQSFSYEPVSRFDPVLQQHLPRPLRFGPESEQLFLVIFGTGMRALVPPDQVKVTTGPVALPVTFLGPAPGYAGLDQLNLGLPRMLAGAGELTLEVVIDGWKANPVLLTFEQ